MSPRSARAALQLAAVAAPAAGRSIMNVAGPSVLKLAPVQTSRRAISTSKATRQLKDDSTPARTHRSPESPTAAGGPDVEPLSGQPRNSSTEAGLTRGQQSAQEMADFAQGLLNRGASPHLQQQQQQQMSASAAGAAARAAAPYTPEALAQRTDPLLEAFVNNLMRDGKKAQATSHVLTMLDHLRRALHADPLPALKAAVEAASPLVRMQTRKGGGKNVQVPVALRAEQSQRRGIVAILDASKKRSDRHLSMRMAREVIAVLEGTSSTLTKKEEAHRVATMNRSNASVRI